MPASARSTLADVAAAAGVSVTTASRALRGQGEMAAATRARVAAAAAALRYTHDGERRGRPRGGTARLIDLVLSHFHNPYTEEVTAGARTAAAHLRYDLVLTTERDDPDDDWPVRIRSRGSAGVVLGLILPTATQTAVMREAGIPVVLLEPPSGSSRGLPSVRSTDRAGGSAAAEHLIARGAGRFVVIGGSPPYRWGRARVEGFFETLDAALPRAARVHESANWGAAEGREACRRALERLSGDGPVGVFACSDEMAAGAYRAVADAGLRVGVDVLIVGFDDLRGARWLQPSLTTVRQPIREMAAAAVRMLAAGTPSRDEIVELPTELIARGSTRGPGG